ncbi:MAG: 30S ribosomal protein S3, partial [Parcubacteria group bacterium]
MGKKINPKIFRLKQTRTWDSKWFSNRKNYAGLLRQDLLIKKLLKAKLAEASVSDIQIERTAKEVNVFVYSGRPGVILGRGGAGLETLKKEITRKIIKDQKIKFSINIKEVSNPNLDASILGQGIKADIEKRIPFRRAMKQGIAKAEKAGA